MYMYIRVHAQTHLIGSLKTYTHVHVHVHVRMQLTPDHCHSGVCVRCMNELSFWWTFE